MSYTISQAPAGGTQVNQYATQDPAKAQAATDYMTNWEKQNPTGYATNRDFLVADSAGYDAYQAKRAAAYDSYLKQPTAPTAPTQTGTQAAGAPVAAPNGNTGFTGIGMPIIQTAMQNAQQAGQVVQPVSTAQNSGQQMMQINGVPTPTQGQTGGIINNQLQNNVGADGQLTGYQTYNAAQLGDPTKWNVTSEQTMQGQLGQIMSQDGMLMQMAQARALEQMNERGLSNSSLAIGAGQRAIAEVAMPIAQNDAGVHAKAAGYNADIENIFKRENVNWQNQALQFGAEQGNLTSRANADNRTQVLIGRERNDTTRWAAQLDADTRTNLGKLDSDTRRYIADQDVGVRRELGYLDATVRREDIGVRKELGYLDAAVRREDIGMRRDLGNRELDVRKELGYLDADVRREGFSVQRELGYLDANTRSNIASMSNSTQIAVAEMGHQYQQQLQASEAAAAQFRQMSQNLLQIDGSNLDVQSKEYAKERQMMLTADALNLIGSVNNVPNLGYYYQGGY